MSSRAVIRFGYTYPDGRQKDVAMIYRHCDGYPEAVVPDLVQFFEDVTTQTSDTRFDDPSYLAAKFVVWQAGKDRKTGNELDFLGVGVVLVAPSDTDFTYLVDCGKHDKKGRPLVIVQGSGE